MNSSDNTHQPLVSVVIPCYNRENFVADAIESVLKQTYQNFEVILVDDGSADHTENVIQRYLSDPRIRFYKHDVNRGIAAARNTGIKNAKGEFIALLDSDDMWLPKKIETQVEILSQDTIGELGVVWTDAYYTDQLGNKRTSDAKIPADLNALFGDALLRRIFMGNFIIAGTSMIRRSCFDRIGFFDEQLRGGSDDCDLWIRLAPYFQFRYLASPLAVIRLHEGNYSSIERHFQDQVVIIAKAISRNPEIAALKQKKLSQLHHSLGTHYFEKGNSPRAREHFWKSIKANPFNVKPLVKWMFACTGSIGMMMVRTCRQLGVIER